MPPESLTDGVRATFACQTAVSRDAAPAPRFSLLDEMWVERGTKEDWERLKELHYKASALSIGPRFWRLRLGDEVIGVLVTCNPKGILKERQLVFPTMRITGEDTRVTNTLRFKFANDNFRCVSRFVIDTMYRGIGAGYRMMNLVSRLEGNRYMEIQSSMSKFNTFGQKAGFKFIAPRNSTKFEAGIKFFRSNFQASPQDFEAIVAEIEARSPAEQAIILEACKDFYHKNSVLEKTGKNRDFAAGRVERLSVRTAVKQIQQLALASPLYGIWVNPDHRRPMPERLPLSAFDLQRPTERLAWRPDV